MSFPALFVSIACSIATIIINFITMYKVARSFGHSLGYTVGLIFLGAVFVMILGFGRSEYIGPNGIKEAEDGTNNQPNKFGTAT